MATTPTRLTIDDFERLPAEQAKNHELIDGELVTVRGNTLEHNFTQGLLFTQLWFFVRKERFGTVVSEQEYDFDGRTHAPDISFYGAEKQPLQDPKKRVQRFIPDLAIEIASDNDSLKDLLRKKDRYRLCGTSEVWILAPDSREIFVFSDHGNRILAADDELTTPLLPGFRITVKQLFEAV